MKALFIVHDVYQETNHFPLGVGYLASMLHNVGVDVETYCMDIFHYTDKQLSDHLRRNTYDLIGMGFLAARYVETVKPLCNIVNKYKKNAWFVLGGHGPSPIPEFILRDAGVDIVAIGEAENTIVDIINCKKTGGDLYNVDGIGFIDDVGSFVKTNKNRIFHNLDDIPFPLWNVFPMEYYTTCIKTVNQGKDEKSFPIVTSRGCINSCSFCYRMEKGIRLRSVGNIIDEIKFLREHYGIDYFLIQDEMFVVNKKRLLDLDEQLRENDLKIKFTCSARADIVDVEIIGLLKKCGCQFVNIGFESSSNKVLNLMNKKVSVEQNIKALEIIKKSDGIGIGLNFIWNNPGDTVESLMNNMELIKKYNTFCQCRTIRPVTPYPGSSLYNMLVDKGIISSPEVFFNRFTNSDLISFNFMEDISDEQAHYNLLEVNTNLILDHYNHNGHKINNAMGLINQFANLYSGKDTHFRGSRVYEKEKVV